VFTTEVADSPSRLSQAMVDHSLIEAPKASISVETIPAWLPHQSLLDLSQGGQSYFTQGDANAVLLVLSFESAQTMDKGLFSGKCGVLLRAMLNSIGHKPTTVLMAALDTSEQSDKSFQEVISNSSISHVLLFIDQSDEISLQTIDQLREKCYPLNEQQVQLHVSYHPNILLQNAGLKRQAWTDLKQLKKALADVD